MAEEPAHPELALFGLALIRCETAEENLIRPVAFDSLDLLLQVARLFLRCTLQGIAGDRNISL